VIEGRMIGNNGKVDGNIKLMPLKIDNGIKIERNYLEKTVMDGGGFTIKVKTSIYRRRKIMTTSRPIGGDISPYDCPKCERKLVWAEFSEGGSPDTEAGLVCENVKCEFEEVQPCEMEDFVYVEWRSTNWG